MEIDISRKSTNINIDCLGEKTTKPGPAAFECVNNVANWRQTFQQQNPSLDPDATDKFFDKVIEKFESQRESPWRKILEGFHLQGNSSENSFEKVQEDFGNSFKSIGTALLREENEETKSVQTADNK